MKTKSNEISPQMAAMRRVLAPPFQAFVNFLSPLRILLLTVVLTTGSLLLPIPVWSLVTLAVVVVPLLVGLLFFAVAVLAALRVAR